MFGAIVSLSFTIGISVLLISHTIFLLTNTTTIEIAIILKKNPFSEGSWK
jgi:hypothetical protein